MSLTPTQEAQVLELLNQQAALLSLAQNEATITSKLAATKVNLGQLTPATALTDTDLMLVRQGTTDKSVTGQKVKELAQTGVVLQSAFTGSNVSLTSNGYQKLPSGLIIQWGTSGVVAADTNLTITFPIAFPNTPTSVSAIDYAGVLNKSAAWSVDGFTAANMQLHWSPAASGVGGASTRPARWIAIGH